MNKYRIVKRANKFFIQRKTLWFWEDCENAFEVPIWFYSEAEAQKVIEDALRPDEVVKEF